MLKNVSNSCSQISIILKPKCRQNDFNSSKPIMETKTALNLWTFDSYNSNKVCILFDI